MALRYHIGVSGGKDSDALLLYMVYESGIPHEQLRVSFCDTGNEHEYTYEQIRMLNRRVFDIDWIIPPLDFYELAIKKKRFPSSERRFCTQHLKLMPTKAYIDRMLDSGYEVIACSGIRADESVERSRLPEFGDPMESYFGIREWRPLMKWKWADVVAIHERYGIPMNPLYEKGAKRVGCFPCIMSNKAEIRNIAINFPERIDMIRRAEHSVDSCGTGQSTFFPINSVPRRFRSLPVLTNSGKNVNVPTIDDVVAWSMTGWRAKGRSQNAKGGLFEESDLPNVCPSNYGACE